VGHDEHRAAEIEQSRLERLARGNIKVVRWLVEQQDIRAREHQLQERKPRFFAAAQSLYLLENIVRAEQELPEQSAHTRLGEISVQIPDFIKDCIIVVERGERLVEIADLNACAKEIGAGVGFLLADKYF